MHHPVYGFDTILAFHGITTSVKLSSPLSSNSLADYSITMTIKNRSDRCVVLKEIPIDNSVEQYVIPNGLISKLNGKYYLDIVYTHNTTDVTSLDRNNLNVEA